MNPTPLFLSIGLLLTLTAAVPVVVRDGSIAGDYLNLQYGANSNDWHFVRITEEETGSVYKWTNKAGVSWSLTRDEDDAELFHVGEECPYYSDGYITAQLETTLYSDGSKLVTGIRGPSNELYTAKYTADPWNTTFCPFGNVDATCWPYSAYQRCYTKPHEAFHLVSAESSSGTKGMYEKYMELVTTGVNCTD